jgi:SPP1 gp7 family putative phage head morphogenesis protein
MKVNKDEIINNIWLNLLSEWNLPENLYLETSQELMKGVQQGFGSTLLTVKHTGDFATLKQLHDNIYVFSAAKTFQNTLDIRRVIFNEQGYKRSFSDFKKDAGQIFDVYNDVWLKTEFDTSITQAYAASQWDSIEAEKDVLPFLRFQTTHSDSVCPVCREFDGKVRHVNDPFWNWATPPLHFSCHCLLIQENPETKMTLKSDLPSDKEVPEMFRMNPGKDKYVFPTKGQYEHPYFKVAQKYLIFKNNNFGLTIPEVKKK